MIRPYLDRDLDELIDVWFRASRVAHPFLSLEFLDAERGRIAEQWLPLADTSVYERDGRVVGFMSLIDNEVGGIFVDPDLQGNGIGRALMDSAREVHPVLELDVFEANAIGRRFYDRYGFEFVDRHMNHTAGQSELRLRFTSPHETR